MDKTTEVHQTKKMLKAFKWIVFLLIIIVCMPPFSIRTENGSKKIHLISMILNPSSIPEIVTSLIKSVIEPRGKHKITKPNSKTYKEQAQLVRNSEIYGIDSNEDNSTDSQYNSKKLAQNKSKQQENNSETGSKKNSTESSKVTHNTTLNSAILNSRISNNQPRIESNSNKPDDNSKEPNPANAELTFEEVLLNSGEFSLENEKYRVWVHKKTGVEFIHKEKDDRNIVIFRNSCANGKPLDNYKEICENIYNITSFNKISELKKFQVQKYPFYSVEKWNKNENGKFDSENICNENGLYNTQCPFWELYQSYFPKKELEVIKNLTNSNNCEGYRKAYSQLLIGLKNLKKIYSVGDYFILVGILGSINISFENNKDILRDNPTYSTLNNILENFFPMIDDIDDNSIYTKLYNMLINLNEFYPDDSDSSSPYEDLQTILLGYILENLNEFYSASVLGSSSSYEDLKTILENLRGEIVRLMNENQEELQQLFTALQQLYGISDCDTWIPETSQSEKLPDMSPYEKLLDTLKKLSPFFKDGSYTKLKEIINDSTEFDLLNYTLTTTITPQENPILTTEREQPKEIKLTVGFRPIFVFHK